MASEEDKWNREVFLGLGSNQGDRKLNLAAARNAISNDLGPILKVSAIYQTEAWGANHLNVFYNQVVQIATDLKPMELLKACLLIEKKQGRKANQLNQYENRLLDVDLLFFGDYCCEERDLILPHPHIAKRNFVLVPMAEIASDFKHPLIHKTIAELQEASEDVKRVEKIS